jgi:hypothetical protein
MCKENDADEVRPAADTGRNGQRIPGRGPKRPIAVHLISALFTGLVGFAAGSLGIRNAYCALSPSGCPTEQVADLKIEAPVPWEVDFGDWRVEAQANKDCPIVSEPPTGPPFGVEVPFQVETKGFKRQELYVEGHAVYAKTNKQPGVTKIKLTPKSAGRRIVCSIWVQYPDRMGLSGWNFFVQLDASDAGGSRLDSIQREVALKPITLLLNGEKITDDLVDIQGLLSFPLMSLVDRLGWRLQCAKTEHRDAVRVGCTTGKGEVQRAIVLIDGSETALALTILPRRGPGGEETGVGFVNLSALAQALHWKYEWRSSARQLIVETR